jgi:formylmethanofuran dehydrogenase subunit B
MAVCTGCSLLCDDIEVTLDHGKIAKTKNLCRKGHARFKSIDIERSAPSIDGRPADVNAATKKAVELLSGSKRPLILGLTCSTARAQSAALSLAKATGATIDDGSSICEGMLIERVIGGRHPTCTLDDVRNYADMSVFWGFDPSSSHPRHMSRFSYYPRGEKRQKGYEEDRTALCVDVRKSPTAKISGDGYLRVPPTGDESLIGAISDALDGKVPKVQDKKRIIAIASSLRKAEFGAVFPGVGLIAAGQSGLAVFDALLDRLNAVSKYKLISSCSGSNTRGLSKLLFDEKGSASRASFAANPESNGQGINGSIQNADLAVVVGGDPIACLPLGIASRLSKIPIVVIDAHRTLTSMFASVCLPCALSGLESGGEALRMDGVQIKFESTVKSSSLSEEDVLKSIQEGLI